MPGPKPTPTAIKVQRGNPGRRPLSQNEPKLAVVLPPHPKDLSPSELAAWSDLSGPLLKMKVLTEADAVVLELAAVELALYREAREHIAKEGTVDREGDINSWLQVREGAWKKLFRMLAACGMTPADRTKVSVVGDGAADPFEEFLQS